MRGQFVYGRFSSLDIKARSEILLSAASSCALLECKILWKRYILILVYFLGAITVKICVAVKIIKWGHIFFHKKAKDICR